MKRPLRLLITRAAHQQQPVADLIKNAGMEPVLLPLIRIQMLPADMPDPDGSWVAFTSVNSVAWWKNSGLPDPEKTACVGEKTARACRKAGYPVTLVADVYDAEHLASALEGATGKGDVVLYPRSAKARTYLIDYLTNRGRTVIDLPVYDTVPDEASRSSLQQLLPELDGVLFFSPTAVRAFFELGGRDTGLFFGCVGRKTEEELRRFTGAEALTPDTYTAEALIELISLRKGVR
ncbi:uroporphyrinogen-III synthase [Alkalicoccus luteus]|uniref:Uroporphyrinogen-III synthase n=1 Tax=Alkalicoccus luteus TaxID=1237094 RepID=A0A969PQU1_9BACI|nr:uroporphyrinogen-III synthase [Alkalicoccus luteus]NJP36736.1 uroporphyrinogen-III synthase [Alkalicoccus luteus]